MYRLKLTFLNSPHVGLLSLHNDLEVFQVIAQLLHLGLIELHGRLELL